MNAEKIDKFLNEKKWQKIGNWGRQKGPYFKKNAGIEGLISLGWSKKFLKKGRAIDIGCGAGRNAILFSKNGFESYGIDFSKTAIKLAKNLAKEQESLAKFKCESILSFNQDKKFDLAMDFGCFHHLRKSQWNKYIKNILKLLNKKSYFLLYCFSKKSKETGNYKKGKDYSLRKGAYNRYFEMDELIKIFSKYFKPIKSKTIKEKGRLLAFNLILFKKI